MNLEYIGKMHSELLQWVKNYLAKVYEERDFIKGEQLLRLTPIDALNRLLLGQLFEEWRRSIEESKSPYFDYEHPDVRQALEHYANVLSHHIRIEQRHMEKLLLHTLESYLQLLLTPYEFFIGLFEKAPVPLIDMAYLRKLQKYILPYAFLVNALIERMEQQRMQALPPLAMLGLFKVVYEQYRSQLKPDTQAIEELFGLIPCLKPSASSTVAVNSDTSKDLPKVEAEKPISSDQIYQATSHDEEEDYYGGGLNERFKQLTRQAPTVRFVPMSNRSLRDSISLHERFLFVERLFGGSHHAYQQFIQQLEKASSYQEASHIVQAYVRKLNWSNGEALDALHGLLQRVFSD